MVIYLFVCFFRLENMSKSGTFSMKKPAEDGRRIFKDKTRELLIVLEKWQGLTLRVIFIKDSKIVPVPLEYTCVFSNGRRTENISSTILNGNSCFILSSEIQYYTVFCDGGPALWFDDMEQYAVNKGSFIQGLKRDIHDDIFKDVNNILGP